MPIKLGMEAIYHKVGGQGGGDVLGRRLLGMCIRWEKSSQLFSGGPTQFSPLATPILPQDQLKVAWRPPPCCSE